VPAKGERVMLRNNANLSTGGTATDVTDDVHPEVAAAPWPRRRWSASTSAGVDVVCETMQEAAGGAGRRHRRSERRARPAHAPAPSFGKGRPVGEAIIAMMFEDPNEDGRIPVVAVTGTNGKTTTVRLIAHLLEASAACASA
jgi:cyanophycin synthetase